MASASQLDILGQCGWPFFGWKSVLAFEFHYVWKMLLDFNVSSPAIKPTSRSQTAVSWLWAPQCWQKGGWLRLRVLTIKTAYDCLLFWFVFTAVAYLKTRCLKSRHNNTKALAENLLLQPLFCCFLFFCFFYLVANFTIETTHDYFSNSLGKHIWQKRSSGHYFDRHTERIRLKWSHGRLGQ